MSVVEVQSNHLGLAPCTGVPGRKLPAKGVGVAAGHADRAWLNLGKRETRGFPGRKVTYVSVVYAGRREGLWKRDNSGIIIRHFSPSTRGKQTTGGSMGFAKGFQLDAFLSTACDRHTGCGEKRGLFYGKEKVVVTENAITRRGGNNE